MVGLHRWQYEHGGDDFIGQDKHIHNDEVHGDKVMGNKIVQKA